MNPPRFPRNNIVNFGSYLLSDAENLKFFDKIGSGYQSLSTASVRIYKAGESNGNKSNWTHLSTGISAVIRDHRKRWYLLYLYSLAKNEILLSEKLNEIINYAVPTNIFHTFQIGDEIYMIQFTDPQESQHFHNTLHEKQKFCFNNLEKLTPMSGGPPKSVSSENSSQNRQNVRRDGPESNRSSLFQDKNKNPPQKKLEKNKNEVDSANSSLIEIFQNSGIDPTSINNAHIDIVHDFIAKNGGIESVRAKTEKNAIKQKKFENRIPAPAPLQTTTPKPPKPLPPLPTPKLPLRSPKLPLPSTPEGKKSLNPSSIKGKTPPPLPKRNDIFSCIRQGVKLTKVDEQPRKEVEDKNYITGLLKKAIENRHSNLNYDDEDNNNDETSWSD